MDLSVGYSWDWDFHGRLGFRHRPCFASAMKPVACFRALAVFAALSLSVACGSSQSEQQTSTAGAAGASGSVESAGSGAGGGSGHDAGGSGGANGGSAGAAGDAGKGGAGSGGTSGSGGTLGSGGTSGSAGATGGGGGGAQAPACPPTAPASASACTANGQRCFYEDCAGAGRTAASCNGSSWTVQTGACGVVQCIGLPGGMNCASGRICAVSFSGSIGGMCNPSSCGKGPVTCDCAGACANCAIAGSVEQGVTVTCNNCPQGGCA
jgi:hypothetical protein